MVTFLEGRLTSPRARKVADTLTPNALQDITSQAGRYRKLRPKRYAVPGLRTTLNRSDSMHSVSMKKDCMLGIHDGVLLLPRDVVHCQGPRLHISTSDSFTHLTQKHITSTRHDDTASQFSSPRL